METKLYIKKIHACESVFMSDSFPYRYHADVNCAVGYVHIIIVAKLFQRPMLRKMERHYMFFYSVEVLGDKALLHFYVSMPSHRAELVETINRIAKARKLELEL